MCRACYEMETYDSDDDPFGEREHEDPFGERESSEDEERQPRERGIITKQPLQDEICNAIDCIGNNVEGGYASSGPLTGPFADPRLSVDQGGLIEWPLNERDAQRIIAASHQAPFGKMEQTIVDTNVRRTWELNASDFTIQNRSFRQLVRNTIITAMSELGVASSVPVRADLYNMLLYEKGAMFKPHVDSEKAPGMFATMVVCLPSPHVGGDVCLKHDGSSMRISTAELQPSYLCWYSNVEHEVKPVLDGYRLVLTYNLVRTDLEDLQASAPPAKSSKQERDLLPLQAALQEWTQLDLEKLPPNEKSWPREIIYRLEHQYTEASLSMERLQLADLAKAEALQSLAQTCGLTMLFATMERFVHEGEHEVFDDVVELKAIFDTAGTLLISEVPTKEENILQADVFGNGRQPDDAEHEPYTGNAGAEDNYWYRDTVLVLVRNDKLVEFLTRRFQEKNNTVAYRSGKNNPPPALLLIQALTKEVYAKPEDSRAKDVLEAVCNYFVQANCIAWETAERIARSMKDHPETASERSEKRAMMYQQVFDDTVMASIVHAAIQLDAAVQLDKVMMVQQAVRSVRHKLDKEAVDRIRVTMHATDGLEKEHLRLALINAVENYDTFSERYHLLLDPFEENGKTDDWAIESLAQVLEESTEANEEDGVAVAELLRVLNEDDPILGRRAFIIAAAKRLASSQGRFIVALLASFCFNHAETQDHARAKAYFMEFYTPASFGVHVPKEPEPSYRSFAKPRPSEPAQVKQNMGELLAAVVTYGLRLRSADINETLMQQLKDGAKKTPKVQAETIYLPFVRKLLDEYGLEDVDASMKSTLLLIITNILVNKVIRSIPKQPAMAADWTRPGVSCPCQDFELLPSQSNATYWTFPDGKDETHASPSAT